MLMSRGRRVTSELFDPVTFTFNLLTSNEMCDLNLACTVLHLPSLVMIYPVGFLC